MRLCSFELTTLRGVVRCSDLPDGEALLKISIRCESFGEEGRFWGWLASVID